MSPLDNLFITKLVGVGFVSGTGVGRVGGNGSGTVGRRKQRKAETLMLDLRRQRIKGWECGSVGQGEKLPLKGMELTPLHSSCACECQDWVSTRAFGNKGTRFPHSVIATRKFARGPRSLPKAWDGQPGGGISPNRPSQSSAVQLRPGEGDN